MSINRRIHISRQARFCTQCLSPTIFINSKAEERTHRRTTCPIIETTKFMLTCLHTSCLQHSGTCTKHRDENRPRVPRTTQPRPRDLCYGYPHTAVRGRHLSFYLSLDPVLPAAPYERCVLQHSRLRNVPGCQRDCRRGARDPTRAIYPVLILLPPGILGDLSDSNSHS